MANNGPIILIDDDEDDVELLMQVFKSLEVKNEIIRFENGFVAWEYLNTIRQQPFLILCDINMPKMNGIELLKKIHGNEALRKKSIPFVFLSTNAKKTEVAQAYEMTVQGYFLKGTNFPNLQKATKLLLDYWSLCIHPFSN